MHPDSQLTTAVQKGFDPKILLSSGLEKVDEPVRTILEKHSRIPAEKILQHVLELRERAFKVFPYACIGQFSFLQLSIAASPCYPEMLGRVKRGQTLLDLGCAFGQELRQLIFDGAPPENLYGSDLQQDFLNLGYDLFLDRDTLPESNLISADILDRQSRLFLELSGQLNIIYVSLFLHVFDFDKQIAVAKNMLDLLIPEPGSMIVGRITACRDQAALQATQARMPYYYHDTASWDLLWDEVQKKTGIKLAIENWEQPDELVKKHPLPGIYILGSAIRRL